MSTTTITPFLWFDGNAEQAVEHYTSLFPGSRVTQVSRRGKDGGVFCIGFELAGRPFLAMNGGPHYKFTPAVSLLISCDSQEEVDRFWNGFLAGGGKEVQCGWLEDKFGLSWQVIPRRLGDMMSDPDPAKAGRVGEAMMKMKKLDVAALERAYEGQ